MKPNLQNLTQRLLYNDQSLTFLKLDDNLEFERKLTNYTSFPSTYGQNQQNQTPQAYYNNNNNNNNNEEQNKYPAPLLDYETFFLLSMECNQTVQSVFIFSSLLRQLPEIHRGNMILKALMKIPKLKCLSMSLRELETGNTEADEQLKQAVTTEFMHALASNPKLNTLELYAPGLDWSALKSNATLTKLDLSYNGIGVGPGGINEGGYELADAIKYNQTLSVLDLSYNKIQSEALVALCSTLEYNTTLTTVILGCNGIVDQDCVPIAEVLKKNQTLISISLRDNAIGNKGCQVLVNALVRNKQLVNLDLTWNRIYEEGWTAVTNVVTMARNMTLGYVGDHIPNPNLSSYLRLNRSGRQHLITNYAKNGTTQEEWTEALINVHDDVECMFYFLSTKPDLCKIP